MPISDLSSDRAYVWTWLPGASSPVVAGVAEAADGLVRFAYARSYLERDDAIALAPELQLRSGTTEPRDGLTIAGALRDAMPDGWGRSVIERRLGVAEGSLTDIDYMLNSGSDRFGAVDFQLSPTEYIPRIRSAPLDELHDAAIRLEEGRPLSEALSDGLLHGTSIGGARPKAIVVDESGEYIAKFPSSTDRVFKVVNAEAAAMFLAERSGINVSRTRVTSSLGKDVLLVRRFDRVDGGRRRHVVSALTLAGLAEMNGRYATYPDLLDTLRRDGRAPGLVGRELFARVAFNIAISNSDDHARNHAAFWDGKHLDLTPAFDLAPGNRTGDTATQAIAYGRDGENISNFAALLGVASTYGLSATAARDVTDGIIHSIREHWAEAVDVARLPKVERDQLWGLQFLNPAAFYDY